MKHDEILTAHRWRFACKEFIAGKKISDEDFKFLLDIIQLAPTSFGLQPFQVFVLQKKELLDELLTTVWGGQLQFPSASHILMFAVRKDIRHDGDFIRHVASNIQKWPDDILDLRVKKMGQFQLDDFKLLDDDRYLFDWAGKQAYIALGNVMSAAAEIGIDSCAIEGFNKENVANILAKHNVLDPNELEPCVFCALGYRAGEPSRAKTRRAVTDLIHFVM